MISHIAEDLSGFEREGSYLQCNSKFITDKKLIHVLSAILCISIWIVVDAHLLLTNAYVNVEKAKVEASHILFWK